MFNLAATSDTDNEDVARICLGTLSCEEDSENLSESDTESFVDDVFPEQPADFEIFPPPGEEDSDSVEEDFDDGYISRRRCAFIDDEAIESDHGGEICSGRKGEKAFAVEESPVENHRLELEYVLEGNPVGSYSAPQDRTVEASDVELIKVEDFTIPAGIPSPQRIRFVNRIRTNTKPSDSKSLESFSPTITLSPGLSSSPIPERSVSSLSQGVATKLPADRASDKLSPILVDIPPANSSPTKLPESPQQASKHNLSPHKALSDYVSRNEINSPLDSPKTSFIERKLRTSSLAESEGIRQDSKGEQFEDDESTLWSTRESLCPNSQWDPLLEAKGLPTDSFGNERSSDDPQIVVTNSLNTERGFQAAKHSLFDNDSDGQASAHSFMTEQGTQTTKTVKRGKTLPPHSLDVPVNYPSDCSSGQRHDSYVLLERTGIGQDETEFKASEKWTARDMCELEWEIHHVTGRKPYLVLHGESVVKKRIGNLGVGKEYVTRVVVVPAPPGIIETKKHAAKEPPKPKPQLISSGLSNKTRRWRRLTWSSRDVIMRAARAAGAAYIHD